ncbi:hypothetical protein GCM10009096_07230 [Parasphingorhabdus litoris]|uniref:Sulfatase-modifying factor enzyme-like domain-containing protein n=1 Tax=Parasphingorhabdus litoris TaxID=394733 RepID=A0ABN1A6N3_9SPHN|nr:SUMF1/EgtB/PvdO family nonheme iron enzyme [Parasphingorhabdus litoris]
MISKLHKVVSFIGLAFSGSSVANADAGNEIRFCEKCPIFVEVPSPPIEFRQIKYVAKYELMWKDYLQSVTDGNCTMPKNLRYSLEADPATIERMSINWTLGDLDIHQMHCFADWVESHTDLKIDLPETEEWMWFARAEATSKYPWVDEADKEKAMVNGTKSHSRNAFDYGLRFDYENGPYPEGGPVGQFPPNKFGLYDIIGNHAEITKSTIDAYDYFKEKGLDAPAFRGRLTYPVLGGSFMTKIEDANIDNIKWSLSSFEGAIVTSTAVRLVAYSDR